MRKVLFSLLVIMGLVIIANNATAQIATKVGFFDSEQMASALPEAKDVQTKMDSYQRDSLGTQKDKLDTLYNDRLNTYKNDSLAKKSTSILDYDRKQLSEVSMQEYQWSQYAQQAAQQKYYQLMAPLYQKVHDALDKAAKENHITAVVKMDSFEWIDDKQVINMFIPVAKILGIALPQQNSASGTNAPASGK